MTTELMTPRLLDWSADVARRYLATRRHRLRHSIAVGRKAARVARSMPPTQAIELVAAAHLHDIGYADELAVTGLHQVDGAQWLASRGLPSIAGLVAHHSEAAIELALRERSDLLEQFQMPERQLLDALTYCDVTTGPSGQTVTLDERIEDVGERHGQDSVVYKTVTLARPRYERAIERTLALMSSQVKVAASSPLK